MPIVTMFWIALDCPSCSARIPQNGLADGGSCRACGKAVSTPPGFWRRVLEPAVRRSAGQRPGVGACHRLSGDLTAIVVHGRTEIRCALCARPTADARAGRSRLSCRHCGAHASVRPTPPWLRLPGSLPGLLVGETLRGFLHDPLPWYVVSGVGVGSGADEEAHTIDHVRPWHLLEQASGPMPVAPTDLGFLELMRTEPTGELDLTDLVGTDH